MMNDQNPYLIEKLYQTIFETWHTPMSDWDILHIAGNTISDLDHVYNTKFIYPPKSQVFRAFKECTYSDVKVVILGQDPYHNVYNGKPSACGLAFATENGYVNPSLRNIIVELESEYKVTIPRDGKLLVKWCSQGVLLLNTALTVEKGKPKSHLNAWSEFTEKFLTKLSKDKPNLVYLLMGREAQNYKKYITDGWFVETPHPAAEVYAGGHAGFFGSKPFSAVNIILSRLNKQQITWI